MYTQVYRCHIPSAHQQFYYRTSVTMQPKAPLSVEEIPRFQFNLDDQELQSYLKELSFNQAAQKKDLQKLRKELQKRPADFAVAEASSLAFAEIDIDAALLKQLNLKEGKGIQEMNPMRKSAKQFSKKLETVSSSINYLHELFKKLEKRLKIVEIEHPTQVQNKSKYLEGRLQQIQQLLSLDVSNLTQQLQQSNHQNRQSNKQVERKLKWQIDDCRKTLESRITEQYVKDSMAEFEQKVSNRIKEQQIKMNFDPDKFIRMDTKVSKLEHEHNMHVIEVQQQLKIMNDRMVNNLVNRGEYSEDKIKTEKRLTLMNNNISEIHKKLLFAEEDKGKTNLIIKDLSENSAKTAHDVKRLDETLGNMKIGGEYIEMMQKIDVHKICLMDNSIEALKSENDRVNRELEILKKEMERIRMKNSLLQTLQPQQFPHMKVKREQIQQIVVDCLANNSYLKRMQTIELKFADVDTCMSQLSNLDKKVNRLSKENDLHNIVYQLKGLEEYLKREVLLLQNRFAQFEFQFNEKRTPMSRPSSTAKISMSQSNSTINVKKLHPISCIGHYQASESIATQPFADVGMKGSRTTRAASMKWRRE